MKYIFRPALTFPTPAPRQESGNRRNTSVLLLLLLLLHSDQLMAKIFIWHTSRHFGYLTPLHYTQPTPDAQLIHCSPLSLFRFSQFDFLFIQTRFPCNMKSNDGKRPTNYEFWSQSKRSIFNGRTHVQQNDICFTFNEDSPPPSPRIFLSITTSLKMSVHSNSKVYRWVGWLANGILHIRIGSSTFIAFTSKQTI